MKLSITLLLALSFMDGYGQQTITGSVIDDAGQPVPYASIQSSRRKGLGTSADKNGNFKIDEIYDHDTLTCTHISYKMRKEEVFGNNRIIFRLTKLTPSSTWVAIAGYSTPVPVKNQVITTDDEQKIFSKVEVPARFASETMSFQRYLEQNIKCPDSLSVRFDATGEFTGMMVIQFTIDKTGKPINILVVKGINETLDQIAVNTISSMPLWYPAYQNGNSVESQEEVSLYFRVDQKTRRN